MKFKLEINMDSAAFEDNEINEVQRILERVSEQIDLKNRLVKIESCPVRDSNGNKVGTWEVTE